MIEKQQSWFLLILIVYLLGRLVSAVAAQQETVTVCPTDADFASIQAAIDAAKPDSTLLICAATYAENLIVDKNLTLEGEAAATTVIAGQQQLVVVTIAPAITVTLRSLSISNGQGGILNEATLLLDKTTVHHNSSAGVGGILNAGSLTLIDSAIRDNYGEGVGGIFNDDNSDGLNIINSTISGNHSARVGAIWNEGELTLTNSTVSQNQGAVTGGLLNEGLASISNSTLVHRGGEGSSGLRNEGRAELTNSLVVAFGGHSCGGEPVVSLGYNLDNDGRCQLTAIGDQPHMAPRLGPLANNGGATQTHALLPKSPALDAAVCTVQTDQRGVARPVEEGLCDIGSYEFEGRQRDLIFVSSRRSGEVGGVRFHDEDVLVFNPETAVWSLYFDGSDVGINQDLDGLTLLEDGSLLFTVVEPLAIAGFGLVTESDIIKFIPTTLGTDTTGTFEWFLDGSDVGLDGGSEGIDAVTLTADGQLVVSLRGTFAQPGWAAKDEDLIRFNADRFGEDSSGSWVLHFDSSQVHPAFSEEDIGGGWIDQKSGSIYFSLKSSFLVGELSGDGSDILVCPPELLDPTHCQISQFWTSGGFGLNRVDAFHVGNSYWLATVE